MNDDLFAQSNQAQRDFIDHISTCPGCAPAQTSGQSTR